ncbi:MAG: lytic transglycosylase domain-containing protein [Acidobacteriota bacterium]|nr:lytic transglycosylase domain-containing protein [Acidobacteriota bacterium]
MTKASDLAILHNGFSIRHERHEVIGAVTRLYLSHEDSSYVDIASSQIATIEKDLTPVVVLPAPAPPANPLFATSPKPQTLNDVINSAGERNHVDLDLLNSVIHAESGFNVHAVSTKGARGLMQLMPQTATHLGVTNAFDPKANVEGGARYLRELLEKYNFDIVKTLAAYNAGPHRVQQYHGVPPYYETQSYVAKIVREYNRKKLAQRKLAAAAKAASRDNVKQAAVPGIQEQSLSQRAAP